MLHLQLYRYTLPLDPHAKQRRASIRQDPPIEHPLPDDQKASDDENPPPNNNLVALLSEVVDCQY
jgi:hypothetical protein